MDFNECQRGLEPETGAWRRFGSVAVAVLFLAGLAGCSKSPEEVKVAKAAVEAQTTGRLVVKSNRANTTVEAARITPPGEAAKGRAEGAAEQTLAGLPPGKYAVKAHVDGWPEIHQEANVEAGHATEVTFNFKSGSLRLDSDPTGATVRQGEAVLGKTPLVIPQLPPGDCQFTVEYPSWPVVAFKTAITEDVESTRMVRLPYGKLTVETIPAGATVLLGGRAAGQTPLTLEPVSAGPKKLTLQAKDFPAMEVAVTVEDHGEAKVSQQLGYGFPELDPETLLRAVWVPDDPNRLSMPVDSLGVYEAKNGIVKNLHRKRLYENWLRRTYRYAGTVKAYDKEKGRIEFTEQIGELSKFRVLADLSAAARNDKDLVARLTTKGAVNNLILYGRLTAVEEPRWPSKVITFEISTAELLH